MQTIELTVEIPKKTLRTFLPQNFTIHDWYSIKPYLDELKKRAIKNVSNLRTWLKDRSEVETIINEESIWRFIKMTRNTEEATAQESYQYFIEKILPKLSKYEYELNLKFLESPHLKKLSTDKYAVYIRSIEKNVAIYHPSNVKLLTELKVKEYQYHTISGGLSVEIDGKELTMQQARKLLFDKRRTFRKKAYLAIAEKRKETASILEDLFDELLVLRQKIAVNAGFENFRDYSFTALGRFDYTAKQCETFHKSITEEVVPIMNEIYEEKKQQLGIKTFKLWDVYADPFGQKPLQPFEDVDDLVSKTIACLYQIQPYFGERVAIMQEMNCLDLDSRKGKAPGGYNCTLPETGVSFIFMNAVGTDRDLKIMIHESGHAIHGFLSQDLELSAFKRFPSEVAELASMSMELMSMEHWQGIFYDNDADMARAKYIQLAHIINLLPWVATIDKFQHWVYTNPGHTREERKETWMEIYKSFLSKEIDTKGMDEHLEIVWHKQLHLFTAPFYYIEYAIAQLGAVGIWKNYCRKPEKAIEKYTNALKLGYTRPIPEIYKTAGTKFNFSKASVRDLMKFVRGEMKACLPK